MSRRVTTALAALGVAAAGLIGTGGTAHAADPGCSNWAKTAHGAQYRICKGGNVLSWQILTYGANTDERFYVGGHDDCGHSYYVNWNDKNDPSFMNSTYWQPPCNISYGYIDPTESSTPNDGPEVYTP